MPTSLIAAAAIGGTGLSIFGASKSMKASQQMQAAQQQQIQLQMQQEAQRQKLMQLDYQRKQLETLRGAQRARAMSLTTATAQGAQFSSSLQGAYGQTSGQAGTYGLALDQNLQIGQVNAQLNQGISEAKISFSQGQANAQLGSAISGLGSSLVSNAGAIGRIGAVGQARSS